MYSKKFPFALQTIFSFYILEADNFSANYSLQAIFYEKGNPPPPPDKK